VSRPSDPCSLTTNTHDESSTRSTLAHMPSRCLPDTHTIRTCANGSEMPSSQPSYLCLHTDQYKASASPCCLNCVICCRLWGGPSSARHIHSHMVIVTLRSAPAWVGCASSSRHAFCPNPYSIICIYRVCFHHQSRQKHDLLMLKYILNRTLFQALLATFPDSALQIHLIRCCYMFTWPWQDRRPSCQRRKQSTTS
jgi:hypothetical protein